MSIRAADNRIGSVVDLYRSELAGVHPPAEVEAIIRRVFADKLGRDPMRIAMDRDDRLSESELLEVYLPLKQLREGRPLQHALGEVVFAGCHIRVGPSVLIPRPETEEMVTMLIADDVPAPRNLLDIGTGSGCIAIALKKAFPDVQVTATDVSREALAMAHANAVRNGTDVTLLLSDILAEVPPVKDLDIIVSNPPYIPASEAGSMDAVVRDHEPHLALFVQDEDPLLFFRRIGHVGLSLLAPGGRLWMEAHRNGAKAVGELLGGMGYARVAVHTDLSGAPRWVRAER